MKKLHRKGRNYQVMCMYYEEYNDSYGMVHLERFKTLRVAKAYALYLREHNGSNMIYEAVAL